ncbi:hypothetical protein [Spirosoma aerolatum]|uniref:hypothetical protein n=1 Tax=Spirosoma aerolatum TaxID=1211326 RepID=UPI0009ADE56D|nr:hypothetical protein [Spirosoma aerolatum]
MGDIEVSTPAEVDKILDSLQGLQVDFVKITDNAIKPDIYEHLSYLLKAGSSRDKEVAEKVRAGTLTVRVASPMVTQRFDEATAMAVYGRMAKNSTFVVPTLTISRTIALAESATIEATQAINTVILRGTVHTRKTLDELLVEAQKKASTK